MGIGSLDLLLEILSKSAIGAAIAFVVWFIMLGIISSIWRR